MNSLVTSITSAAFIVILLFLLKRVLGVSMVWKAMRESPMKTAYTKLFGYMVVVSKLQNGLYRGELLEKRIEQNTEIWCQVATMPTYTIMRLFVLFMLGKPCPPPFLPVWKSVPDTEE